MTKYPWNRLVLVLIISFIATLGVSYATYHYRISHPVAVGVIPPDPSATLLTPFTVLRPLASVDATSGHTSSGAIFDLGAALGNALLWFIVLGGASLLIGRPKKS